MLALNLRASRVDQLSVIDARRTGCRAGHATETGIKVADPLRGQLRGAFAGEFDEVNAAARRVHFLTPENVSGAGGQTETAVHALVDDLVRRRMVRVESAGGVSAIKCLPRSGRGSGCSLGRIDV